MKIRHQIIFSFLLLSAILVDCFRGFCEDFILNGTIKDDYTHLFLTSSSLAFLLYIGTITYVAYHFINENIMALVSYNFLQGGWLTMAVIDLKQEYFRQNHVYDAGEISMFMFSIAVAFILSAYQWSKRKLKPTD